MGIDLYLINKNTKEQYNLGRAYHYLGYNSYPEKLTLDMVEELIDDGSESIRLLISDILSDLLYQPKCYEDAQNLKQNIKENLEQLREESERVGRLQMLYDLLEEGNFELKQI